MERPSIRRRPGRRPTHYVRALLAGLAIAGCGTATSPSGDVQLQLATCAFSYTSDETGNESCTASLAPTASGAAVSGVIESVEFIGPNGPLPANHEVATGLYVYSSPAAEDIASKSFGPQPYSWTIYASTAPPVDVGSFPVKVRVTYRLNGASQSQTLEADVTVVVSQ